MSATSARLLISCPDRPGIVAAVSGFLFAHGANIVSSDQHSLDPEGGRFFMRMEFTTEALDLKRADLGREFAREVGDGLGMDWRLSFADEPKRLAVLVSREEHCLLDLLWRNGRGELDARVELVVSNHPDLEPDVAAFGIPFHHVPAPHDGRPESESALLALLEGRVDVVILARYMQILSGDFLERVGVPLINIHHSFLPAFAGAGPYAQAKARGVKLIGATAHYATEELDAGPIIEQDVIRVTHRADVELLTRLGSDIERTVLRRAVQWHCEDRVLRDGASTVVF